MPLSLHRSRLRAAVQPSPFLPARAVDPLHVRERLLGLAVALVAATVLAGNGVAAIGSTLDTEQRATTLPRPQTFAVGEQVAVAPLSRDEFTVTWTPPVVHPVGEGAPRSDGFGYRLAPCAGCSSDHNGVDWNPGAGAPVVSIADGVVTDIGGPGGSFGVFVEIEHVVNGQTIRTLSAHMQAGSLRHGVGDVVDVGEVVGAVGSTGQSTGAHLHFEVHVGGAPIDPVPWLAANVRYQPL